GRGGPGHLLPGPSAPGSRSGGGRDGPGASRVDRQGVPPSQRNAAGEVPLGLLFRNRLRRGPAAARDSSGGERGDSAVLGSGRALPPFPGRTGRARKALEERAADRFLGRPLLPTPEEGGMEDSR